MNYPDDGELFKSKNKQHAKNTTDQLVFFVHFLKGHKKVLKRHIDLVNDLGFDAYVFNLKDDMKDYHFLPFSKAKKFGLKHALADQIETHLNLFPEYKKKIVFAFSNIAACAMEAISRRIENDDAKDIKAMICDSGPGVDFLTSSYNLIKYQFRIKSLALRMVYSPVFAFGWSPRFNKDIHKDLASFPKNFPILSIRGWRDQLISAKSIDAVFEPHKHLKWRKLNLPEAGHINGLRDFPNEYGPAVEEFLKPFIKI